jgi:hypothetical protein
MLQPCGECRRHVRIDEARCPFCDCELSLAQDAWDAIALPRLGRSALLTFRELGVPGAIALASAQCASSMPAAHGPKLIDTIDYHASQEGPLHEVGDAVVIDIVVLEGPR